MLQYAAGNPPPTTDEKSQITSLPGKVDQDDDPHRTAVANAKPHSGEKLRSGHPQIDRHRAGVIDFAAHLSAIR
ncbi:hypothetical protein [Saccharopolyspora phatthalungensis]|uniref:Ligand-binding sensor protein n=1 Tax=Saccharopolyspora phatthalungensis TaxID=664693 RepID=A0A840Q8R1_9PSEU|nr:hypothetical protein [Saccharopolyspora phatthalungensis]MBB5156131.1 ligand-binding sensor protein [Saccharopolyspora phatthalungensis]